MSDSAHAGMSLPTKVLLTLGAAGIGFCVLGLGWDMLGQGGGSFIERIDRAIENHPRASQLAVLFFLGISGALLIMALRKEG